LIGLERRKGVITMLKTAELALAEKKPWLFVLSGVVKLSEYPEDERRYFEEQMAKSRLKDGTSNVLFQDELKPIPDGPAFNGVMASFDVLYTAYHDFEGSSNVLTKAAMLQKPVVSTDYGCIGSRTKTYQLGLSIPQGDATQCCQAIEKVLEGKTWTGEPLLPRHAEYHAKHNRKRLDLAMMELLNLLPIAAQAVHEGLAHLF
jgi:glycosyltransferase involved in cell wall biosynthesis